MIAKVRHAPPKVSAHSKARDGRWAIGWSPRAGAALGTASGAAGADDAVCPADTYAVVSMGAGTPSHGAGDRSAHPFFRTTDTCPGAHFGSCRVSLQPLL
jgi:hypothetical protein